MSPKEECVDVGVIDVGVVTVVTAGRDDSWS